MSAGITEKTRLSYEQIFALIAEKPMTGRQIADVIDLPLYMINRHLQDLKKSHCIRENGILEIHGRRGSYLWELTGNPYDHSLVTRSKKDEPVGNTMDTPNGPRRIVKNGNVTTYNLSYHDNISRPRTPEKAHVSSSSLMMI